ncbi:MAG: cupredoxin domain-containing protein [Candidatus Acidiferrales bacterium]
MSGNEPDVPYVHGVKSDELGIANTIIQPGKATDVSFTPTKPGTYKINCSVPCGAGHATMVLTVKVQ